MIIQIITHTIGVNQLDTITKHLTDISHQLVAIKKDTVSNDITDKIKTVGLIVSPILTGFIFFILNRNKEYKIKKSELCGDIYMYMIELKLVREKKVKGAIFFAAHERLYDMAFRDKGHLDTVTITRKKDYEESANDISKYELEENEAFKKFLKYIGQYRYYLSKNKKTQLDKLIKIVTEKELLGYDFLKIPNAQGVLDKMYEELEKYNKDKSISNAKMYNDIEDFMDKNG